MRATLSTSPPGRPRPPTIGDAWRTWQVACTELTPYLVSLALHRVRPQTGSTTEDGLRDLRGRFTRALRRLGLDLEVRDAERVPRSGGLVFMWNQESHLDHIILGAAVPRPFFSLYNNAVARVPVYGEHLRVNGHVHVDSGDEAQWRQAIARAAERVRDGECAVVSPEGTRSRDGRLLPMKRGAFILAQASTRPIVCMTVIGGHEALPRGAAIVRPGRLRVVFSDPIASAGDPDDRTGLMSQVRATFTALKERHGLDP